MFFCASELLKTKIDLKIVVYIFNIADYLFKSEYEIEGKEIEYNAYQYMLKLINNADLNDLESLSLKRIERLINSLMEMNHWDRAKLVSCLLQEKYPEKTEEYYKPIEKARVSDLEAEEENFRMKFVYALEVAALKLGFEFEEDYLLCNSNEEYHLSDYSSGSEEDLGSVEDD